MRNIVKKLREIAVLGYSTQPGFGHEMPSGKISLPENRNVINEDDADELWYKTFETKIGPPIGTNKLNQEYRGPHNDRERRRLPIKTIKNYRYPHLIKR